MSRTGLRPWNIFKKTLYAGSTDGVGRAPVTSRISLARAQLRTAEEPNAGASFEQHLSFLLPPAVAAWMFLLATRWRYSEPTRLRDLEESGNGTMLLDFLGWRVVSHLGPYQMPNFVRAKVGEVPLRRLSEPLLLDHERASALGRVEQMSQRHFAAIALTQGAPQDTHPMCALEPILLELFAPPVADAFASDSASTTPASAVSHKAAAARIVFDVVGALPVEERTVPPWVLSGLVSARGAPWDDGPQGEELRATLLAQLLASSTNCQVAVDLPEVCNYVQQLGFKNKEDTMWPLKAYLLSGETPDLIRRSALLISRQCPNVVEVPPRRARDTPSLQVKRDLRNFWTTTLLTAGWATFRAWRGTFDAKAALAIARACGGACAGMGLLEILWRSEEHVIQSAWYFEDGAPMLAASAAMGLSNCVACAWAFRFATAVPFLVCRLAKDDFLDAYRSFEL